MEDSVIQLIVAVSGLLSTVGVILGIVIQKVHFAPKTAAKIQQVADSLQQTDDWVAEHEVQLKTGLKVTEEIAPEAKAILEANKAKIDALTAEIQAKKQALDELKGAFTGTTSTTVTGSNSGNTTTSG